MAVLLPMIDSLFNDVKAQPLFDGKTFSGFEGNLDWFRIENGAIVAGKLSANIPNNFFLATTKEYHNFELQLKVKTSSPAVNGGIQIRTKRIPNHHEVIGYQADIGLGYWGGLYDESRRNVVLVPIHAETQRTVKTSEWNDYVIRCVNNRIQLFVNGVQTVDYVEADPAIARQSGIIALQIHGGPPAEAWYKDVTIKDLGTFGPDPKIKVRPGSNIAPLGTASMDFPAGGGRIAQHAIDGNHATFAQSSTPVWDLTVDLGKSYPIDKITIHPSSGGWASEYSIEVSTDSEDWTTVAEISNAKSDARTIEFDQIDARYVWMYVSDVGHYANFGHAITEFEIFLAGKDN
jgi:hypothetical protein